MTLLDQLEDEEEELVSKSLILTPIQECSTVVDEKVLRAKYDSMTTDLDVSHYFFKLGQ